MKIAAVSDMHGFLPKEYMFLDDHNKPKYDVLCICGDIVPLAIQDDIVQSISWFLNVFSVWVSELPVNKVIFIAGNHDFFLQEAGKTNVKLYDSTETMKRLFVEGTRPRKLTYLCDNSYVYEGYRFYGSPWVNNLKNWAFNLDDNAIEKKFDMMPKRCDVLLTHSAPNINDVGTALDIHGHPNFGSDMLYDKINGRDIKWSLCGHIHSGNHIPKEINGTNYVNVSIKNENYQRAYPIFDFEI